MKRCASASAPAFNAPNYFGRVINSTCISIGRSPPLTSASVRQASRGAARTGCCAIYNMRLQLQTYNVRLQICNVRLQRRRVIVRRVCLRAFVLLVGCTRRLALREQVQVASVQSYASLLDLVVLSTTTLSKLERVTIDYQVQCAVQCSAAQKARCSASARATLCVCDTVRARAANAARSLRRVRSLPAHASALPGRPRKRADGTAALRGLVRGMLSRAWTCARANAACSLSVVRRRPSVRPISCVPSSLRSASAVGRGRCMPAAVRCKAPRRLLHAKIWYNVCRMSCAACRALLVAFVCCKLPGVRCCTLHCVRCTADRGLLAAARPRDGRGVQNTARAADEEWVHALPQYSARSMVPGDAT